MTAEATTPVCEIEVGEPPGYWHWHKCGRKAKFVVDHGNGVKSFLCTQHAKIEAKRGARTPTPFFEEGGDHDGS